jgi:uncharacterized metal-binding protein
MIPMITKVGIISCSGEAIPEGTIARLATRRVLESLCPETTVTLCLPLFLAGNGGERNFARSHPTITIDGCPKQCAKWGTEKHSGPVSGALVVSELLGTGATGCHRSSRDATPVDQEAIWVVADRIAAEVDQVLTATAPSAMEMPAGSDGECACSSPLPGGSLLVGGVPVSLPGLPEIFEQCAQRGVPVEDGDGTALLEAVKVYHRVLPEAEAVYREALWAAYREFRNGRSSGR